MKKLFFLSSFLFFASEIFAISTITPATLPNGNTGHTYVQQLNVSGGVRPYTWSVSAGTFPAGLSINSANGKISGVLTTTVSTLFTFTITVTDHASSSSSRGYSVTVAPGSLTTPQIVDLWYRHTPDFGGLNDTYYSLSGLQNSGVTVLSGRNASFPVPTVINRTETSYTVSATVTDTALAGGLLTVASGTCTLTMPSAARLQTYIPMSSGGTFDFVVKNIASGGTVTIAAGSGGSFVSAVTGGTTATLAQSATAGIAGWRITAITAGSVYIVSRLY